MRPMVLLVCGAAALCAQEASTRQEPPRNGVVAGQVVDAVTQEPLPKAVVSLRGAQPRPARPRSVRSNSEGKFLLSDIEPGRYRLNVERIGYASTPYGRRRPGQPGVVLDVSPGQTLDQIVVRMEPAGVITGRILDEDGEPLQRMQVEVLQYSYAEGSRQLLPRGVAITDDRGIYRVSGLAADRYYVRVKSRDFYWAIPEQDAEQGYLETYYPGTPDSTQAALVDARPGVEALGIDIQLFPSPTLQIEGQVIDAVTGRPVPGGFVFLIDRDRPGWSGRLAQAPVEGQDGRFQMVGLRPGSYRLNVRTMIREGQRAGTLDIDLGDRHARGVRIVASPSVTIRGKVGFESDAPAAPEQVHIQLQPRDYEWLGGSSSMLGSDGSFELRDTPPGDYKIDVYDQTGAYYLKSARFGSSEALDAGMTVEAGEEAPELVLTLSAHGARAAGQVLDTDDKPVSGAQVVLVPHDRAVSRLFKISASDQTGVYSFSAVTPGRYKLFAWDAIEPGAWLDPNAIKAYETKGKSVEFKEGDAEQLDLKLIEVE